MDKKITKREKDILALIDFSIDDIASILCIEKTTVKTHLSNLFKKFKVHSQIELQRIIYQNEIYKLKNYIIKLQTQLYNAKHNPPNLALNKLKEYAQYSSNNHSGICIADTILKIIKESEIKEIRK